MMRIVGRGVISNMFIYKEINLDEFINTHE